MPTGVSSQGVDLEDLFDPDIMGDGPSAAGVLSAGVPLKFAHVIYGTRRPDVGIASAGQDVAALWAAKNTAVYLSSVSSYDLRDNGTAASASVYVYAQTDGVIYFDAMTGGSLNYHFPTTPGVGSQYQIRVTGSASGLRQGGTPTGVFTGKGGVSLSAAPPPGASANYDTGWQEMAATPLLTAVCNSPPNASSATIGATMNIEIRRKSDNQVVRTFVVNLSCTSDSQA